MSRLGLASSARAKLTIFLSPPLKVPASCARAAGQLWEQRIGLVKLRALAPPDVPTEDEVLLDCQGRKDNLLLWDVADAIAREPPSRGAGDVAAIEEHLA